MNQKSNTAVVYSKEGCVWCVAAKSLLENAGYAVEVKKIDVYNENRLEMLKYFPNVRSVPQVIINDEPIGDYTATRKYLESV